MAVFRLIKHAPGAPGLRLLGLGPDYLPSDGLRKLQHLFDKNAFWAKGRTKSQLKSLLARSSEVVSLWRGQELIGFGRATSDGIYRAVLWDIVVSVNLQGLGLGKQVVLALLETPSIKNEERIYLMTSTSCEFYKQLGFKKISNSRIANS